MCKSLNFAVNKCINWCFVHLLQSKTTRYIEDRSKRKKAAAKEIVINLPGHTAEEEKEHQSLQFGRRKKSLGDQKQKRTKCYLMVFNYCKFAIRYCYVARGYLQGLIYSTVAWHISTRQRNSMFQETIIALFSLDFYKKYYHWQYFIAFNKSFNYLFLFVGQFVSGITQNITSSLA